MNFPSFVNKIYFIHNFPPHTKALKIFQEKQGCIDYLKKYYDYYKNVEFEGEFYEFNPSFYCDSFLMENENGSTRIGCHQQMNLFFSKEIDFPKHKIFDISSSKSNDFLADILKLIFEFCSFEDLIVFSKVNKFWYQQLNHDSDFWETYWKCIFGSFKKGILKKFHISMVVKSQSCGEFHLDSSIQ